ncbi:glycoside hydrolase family protein [Flavivirga eckloniae]|uniref:Glucuronyl hydrolase n=1 Tax=Flavivirga eckloniae TaxID=1803846 RepID=A0A2K9PN75_9FLAO|nr:glycoside hydrolase family 88 protein [Flavivirga eckloniae]AUP78510.1 glucuronyl hydrolase [Flavivirga eckloniae]
MSLSIRVIILLFTLTVSCVPAKEKKDKSIYSDNISVAETQYNHILSEVNTLDKLPNTRNADGTLHLDPKEGWVSGFFPGSLWYLYELSGEEKWKKEAIRWTETLDTIQWYKGTHDIGFMINCSYGNALRLTKDKKYETVLINAAKTLSERFNEKTKTILSWDKFTPWGEDEEYDFTVIIDNMMNLELLYKAEKLSGDTSFKKIANVHANSTIKHHYRPDYSSYHSIVFNPETGDLIKKKTSQGYSDNSSWSRGQAWGLYGFTMCYRETKNMEYLEMAKNIAAYIMNSKFIPEDKVPLWDYHVGQENYNPDIEIPVEKFGKMRDVSAAAITASAFFELSTLVEINAEHYYNYANDIVNVLSTDKYRAAKEEKNYFILKHSVGSIPHHVYYNEPNAGQVDQPINYADYYFLEALVRKKEIDNMTSVDK